ncbi:MAG: SCO7613 C-terminal domain-containing membrane protein, partial [Nocardioidaceae bacterium]
FGLAAGDLVAQSALRRGPAVVAGILAAVTASIGVLGGVAAAGARDRADSWTATGIVAAAAVGAVVLSHLPRFARRLPRLPVVALGSAVTGVVVTLSLHGHGAAGTTAAAAGGVLLLTVAVLLVRLRPVAVGLTSAGAATAAIGDLLLLADQHLRPLSLVLLAATVPAALAAVRVPRLRLAASGAALLAPVAAVLTALGAEWLPAAVAGLLLALVAAAGFALAAVRAGASEEWVWAVGGAVATAAAVATTGTVTAWGQVAIDLAVAGVAAGCYGLVCRRRWVQVLAVTALVVASWTAVAGAEVRTPEAYTLPAAAGLLLIAVSQLRSGARSWAAEGPAVGVALVPSAVMVVASPTVPRLVLVVVAGAAVTTFGTLTHRQAPFLLGALSLAVAVIGRLAPYAPLLPRWLTLGLAGLLLLLLGATYERRIAQAREAVTWIAHMR